MIHHGTIPSSALNDLIPLHSIVGPWLRVETSGRSRISLCGVQVEGGHVPTSDWMLNLQILTSGGYQYAPEPPHH